MPPTIHTRILPPDDHAAWIDFVDGANTGSPYALPTYLEILARACDARASILVAQRDHEFVGGLPLFERDSWAGPYLSGRLLLYYNGFVLADPSTRYPSQHTSLTLETLEALGTVVEQRGYGRIRLHSREGVRDVRALQSRGWRARPSYSYRMPLDDLSSAWDTVEGNFRRLVRRCTEQGMTLTRDEDFDSFYALHLETRQRKGVPLYLPRPQFEQFHRELSEAGLARLYHARDAEGRVQASQLVLASGHPVTHTVCAGASEDALRSGASVFLRWKAFEDLAADGYLANDLTDAELNPVTRFKSRFGAELVGSYILDGPESFAGRVREQVERTQRFPARVFRGLRRRLGQGDG